MSAMEVRIGGTDGMRMVLVPCEAESVAVGVFVASGSRHERPCEAGISHFIEHMLFKGTPTRRPIDITREIEGRGGMLNACTGEEATGYFVHLPDDFLGEAIDLLSDIYLRATMPEDEFVREKSVVIDEIKMYADEPDQVAAENLQRNLFPGSALGSPVAGTSESLAPLRPQDLKRYVRSHYRADNTILAVVGSFDPDRAVAMAKRCFGRLRPLAPPTLRKKPFRRVVPEVVVEKDVQQTQLALGYRTFGIFDPRKYAATVLDGILGRGMMSRLFQELREKRGISYDISSRMQFFSDAGMFTVSAGMDPSKAKIALETIKHDYKKHIAIYDDAMREKALRDQTIALQLPDALSRREIRPYLQAIVDRDGNVIGAEALVRWIHPERGFLSPGLFIPVLEDNGMISDIDRYMWRCASEILKRWERMGRDDLFISVNVSPKDFYFMDVEKEFNEIVEEYGVLPSRLRIEITETAMINDSADKLEILKNLKKDGFVVEMDDFGSGYSSLNMLKDTPVDLIKIDMVFLKDMDYQVRSATILHNVINMMAELGLESIVEGVETREQFRILTRMGGKLFQGYLFAKPLPVEAFEEQFLGMEKNAAL